ncbi:MAG: hypothetical protein OEY94_05830 [Alphaproteobacteria bacterium]|nr:hypothetical protein [Alphaproteobacteria bacterium]
MSQKPEVKINKEMAARILAVQASYQNSQNKKPVAQIIEEYLKNRVSLDIGDEDSILPKPDKILFTKIMRGLEENSSISIDLVNANLKKPSDKDDMEPLLYAVLVCGASELLNNQGVDQPIVVNDYVNVTYCFYEKPQASLVNAVLDKIAKTLKS